MFFFLLCPEMWHVFGGKMLVLSLNVTDAETLGSYLKVNSYYDDYMLTHLQALRGDSETLMMRA